MERHSHASHPAIVLRLWPARDPDRLSHAHPHLPPDHPHLAGHDAEQVHTYVIEDLHNRWAKAA